MNQSPRLVELTAEVESQMNSTLDAMDAVVQARVDGDEAAIREAEAIYYERLAELRHMGAPRRAANAPGSPGN